MGGITLIWLDPHISETLSPHLTNTSDRGEHVLRFSKAPVIVESPPATGQQLFWLLQRKKLDIDTFPTVADIRDKSKTSYLLKATACFQGIWLLVIVGHRPL